MNVKMSDKINAMMSLMPHIFDCYKNNGFEILAVKGSWHNTSPSLVILNPFDVIDFKKSGWITVQTFLNFEDIPPIFYNDFRREFIEHFEDIDFLSNAEEI